MPAPLKPIIYIAFANDLEHPGRNLAGLPREKANIEEAIRGNAATRSQQDRLEELLRSWDLIASDDLTPRALTEPFYSNRVTIFHYAGHAGPEALLLETEEGGNVSGSSQSIIPFLCDQSTLKLVFLNACTTRQWALDLAARAGNSLCVIATSCPVQDALAMQFAHDFYEGLASDGTIQEAFDKALHGANVSLTGSTRGFGVPEHKTNGLPWALYPEGPCAAKSWRLSTGVKNPLLGIPALGPAYTVPDSPYVPISGHRKEDAQIFFGRNAEIREIYDWALHDTTAPIMLFYGQSGSGKSSLLRAGVWPRLEARAQVGYFRRRNDLTDDFNAAVSLATEIANPAQAAEAWLRCDRPAVILFDQVEEAITHTGSVKNHGAKDQKAGPPTGNPELTRFFARLVEIFTDPQTGQPLRPGTKARLILSFRKEFLAEIRNPLVDRFPSLVRDFWLDRLSGQSIIEIIESPVLRDDLRTRYKIALESATGQEQGFAEYLAGRLYDPLSPTATILELELNRLWDLWHPSDPAEREALQDPAGVFQRELQTCRAQLDPLGREQGDAAICYSRKLFDMVKSDHALVRFVHEQLNEIDDPALTQGLAFDLLFEHTTELGTTRRRTMAELRNLYDERIADLNSVIEQFKRLHLLADAVEDGNPQAGVSGDMATRAQDTAAGKEDDAATVLAHDTLAVVVRNEYNLSLLSGPRARRVIENRVRGWSEDKGGDLLQGVELRVVDSGLADIRKLNDREQHFLKASRAARRKRRIRGSIAAACLATLVFAVLGVSLLHERETAAIEGLDTLSETNLASGNQLEAVLQATQAADDLSRWSLVRYGRNRSLRSAVASDLAIALDSTREVGRYRFNALAAQYPDCAAALDADGVPRLLSSGTRDGTLDGAALPPLRGTAALGMLSALFGIQRHSCDPASGIVVSAAPQGNIQLWKIGVTRAKQFPALRLVFPQMLLGVGVSPSAHLVAEWFRDSARQPSQIRIADLETGRLLASLQSGNVIRSVAFSQDSSMIGEAGSKGATVWTVADGQPVKTEFELWQAINIAFGNGKLGPLVAVVYSSSKFSGVEIEAPEVVELGTPLEVVLDYAQEEFSNYVPSPATAAAFSADGAMVAVGREDGKLDLWHVPGSSMFYGVVNAPDLAAALGPRGQPAEAVAFSPDGRFASLVTQAPAPIRVWWVNKAGLQAKSTDGLKKLLSAACERFRPYLDTPAGSRVDPAPDSQIDLRLLARACQSPEP